MLRNGVNFTLFSEEKLRRKGKHSLKVGRDKYLLWLWHWKVHNVIFFILSSILHLAFVFSWSWRVTSCNWKLIISQMVFNQRFRTFSIFILMAWVLMIQKAGEGGRGVVQGDFDCSAYFQVDFILNCFLVNILPARLAGWNN